MHLNKVKLMMDDEIKRHCAECKAERTVAYWDEELESYIYLTESDYCLACEERLAEKVCA